MPARDRLLLFDQLARSLRFWSPGTRLFVYAGPPRGQAGDVRVQEIRTEGDFAA